MTNGSVDQAKVDHVVEQLKIRNRKLIETHGSDLVASQNFYQEMLPTQSDDTDSVGLEHYLR